MGRVTTSISLEQRYANLAHWLALQLNKEYLHAAACGVFDDDSPHLDQAQIEALTDDDGVGPLSLSTADAARLRFGALGYEPHRFTVDVSAAQRCIVLLGAYLLKLQVKPITVGTKKQPVTLSGADRLRKEMNQVLPKGAAGISPVCQELPSLVGQIPGIAFFFLELAARNEVLATLIGSKVKDREVLLAPTRLLRLRRPDDIDLTICSRSHVCILVRDPDEIEQSRIADWFRRENFSSANDNAVAAIKRAVLRTNDLARAVPKVLGRILGLRLADPIRVALHFMWDLDLEEEPHSDAGPLWAARAAEITDAERASAAHDVTAVRRLRIQRIDQLRDALEVELRVDLSRREGRSAVEKAAKQVAGIDMLGTVLLPLLESNSATIPDLRPVGSTSNKGALRELVGVLLEHHKLATGARPDYSGFANASLDEAVLPSDAVRTKLHKTLYDKLYYAHRELAGPMIDSRCRW